MTSTIHVKSRIRISEKRISTKLEELQKLNEELSHIENSAESDANSEKNEEIIAIKSEIDALKAKSGEIDNEISKVNDPTDTERAKIQSEIEQLRDEIAKAEREINQPLDLEKLKNSNDGEITELVLQINSAQEKMKPEFKAALQKRIETYKAEIHKLKAQCKEQKERVDVSLSKRSGDDTKLVDEINELVARNNALNEAIIQITARSEAIDQSRQRHSFLEHLRTSDALNTAF